MEKGNKKRSWLWVLIILLIIGILILLFVRGCERDGAELEKEQVVAGEKIDADSGKLVQKCDSVLEDSVVLHKDSIDDLRVEGGVEVRDPNVVEEDKDTKSQQSEEKKESLKGEDKTAMLQREAEERRRQQEEEEKRLQEEARIADEINREREAEAARIKKEEETEERIMNEGLLSGEFSVAWNKKVRFSQGNLQYQASENIWRFAANQWDHEGMRNERIDSEYSGWIDLFGWGTSGYNKKHPYMISTEYSDYGDGMRSISNSKYDWGVYNEISNGGGCKNCWRVLTNNEWRYLFCKRENAARLFTFATVAGVKGLIVLPDNWKKPSTVKLSYSVNHNLEYDSDFSYTNTGKKANNYELNKISINDWRLLEEAGAVFLPAAGGRDYANIFEVQNCGFYWSGTVKENAEAYMVGFSTIDLVVTDYESRVSGFSVRLVRDVKVK